jgi:UDP-N-acetylglucosamine 2-epimerase
MEEYAAAHPNAKVFSSLGQVRYLSAVSHVNAVVGNSSSGLTEAPSLRKPAVNIGDRQKGRSQAASVINCRPEAGEIERAILQAFSMDCSETINPHGDGESSMRIKDELKRLGDPRALLKKHFFDMAGGA